MVSSSSIINTGGDVKVICSKCLKDLPESKFGKWRRQCKQCRAKIVKEYRKTHKVEIAKNTKEYYRTHKVEIAEKTFKRKYQTFNGAIKKIEEEEL